MILGIYVIFMISTEEVNHPNPSCPGGELSKPERAAGRKEELWNASQIWATSEKLAPGESKGSNYHGSQNQLWKAGRQRSAFLSNALFERSASLRLTWLFWFFLCQDKKNTEVSYEIEKLADQRENTNYEKRYYL